MFSLECFDFKAQNGVTLGCAYQCPDQKSLSGCEMLVVGAGMLTTMIMTIDDADLTFLVFSMFFLCGWILLKVTNDSTANLLKKDAKSPKRRTLGHFNKILQWYDP